MGKRKNKTLKAAAKLGLNPNGWGNGGRRKRSKQNNNENGGK